jgi:hypothetical protein
MDELSHALPVDAAADLPQASAYERFWATVAQTGSN